MTTRIDVYSGDELVGSVPLPKIPPREDRFDLWQEPLTLGIRRMNFDDQFATVITFKVKWHTKDNGWTREAALHCDESFGPGDWRCIPGFRPVRPSHDDIGGPTMSGNESGEPRP